MPNEQDKALELVQRIAKFKTALDLGEEFDSEEQARFFNEIIVSARQLVVNRRNIPPGERCKLAHEVFEAAFEDRDSFHADSIGADLAYLLGSIVHTDPSETSYVDWTREGYGAHPPALLGILKKKFPYPSHRVWAFIVLDE